MARRDRSADDGTALRAFLLAEAKDFRKVLCGIDPQFLAELSKPVDSLVAGEPYRLYRWDLPDWHAERFAGDPNDEFLLCADDELMLYDDATRLTPLDAFGVHAVDKQT